MIAASRRRTAVILALVLALAVLARAPFWLSFTYAYGNGDAMIWEVWAREIQRSGFLHILHNSDTNNIGYHYVLWPTGAMYARISPDFELWTPAIRVLIKVPPFLADLAITALVFFVARGLAPARSAGRDVAAGAAAAAYAIAPASVYDSMWWSQIDSINALAMLGAAVLVAKRRPGWAFALLTIGFLAKPQPLVIVPPLVAYTFWSDGVRGITRGAVGALATAAAALAPWLLHGDARAVGETYQRMFRQDPIDLSSGAWNLWSLFDLRGDPNPFDTALSLGRVSVAYGTLSLLLSAAATLVTLGWLSRHHDLSGLLGASAVMVFTFYMLPTSTHERYLYPAFVLTAPLLPRARWLAVPYALLAATFFLNLLAINPPNASDAWQWHQTRFAVAVASFHVAVYAATMLGVAVTAIWPWRHEPDPRFSTGHYEPPDTDSGAVVVTL